MNNFYSSCTFPPTLEYTGVQIWDNLIDDQFLLDLDQTSNHWSWHYANIANAKSWPYKQKGSHTFWISNILHPSIPNFEIPPIVQDLYDHIICNVVKRPFKLHQIQANGQSLGQDGTVHIDHPSNSGGYTLMLFINHKWDSSWGGEFQILEELNNDSKIINSIQYNPGRILLFEGDIPHRALGPKVPSILRKSLVFRLEEIK